MNELLTVDLGRTKYSDAWDLQKKIFAARLGHRIGDVLLFTEHDHVYTLGKAADDNHLLAGEEELRRKGIDVHWIDRGGDVTYHGPGQIVGYPTDIHRYLRDIEEVIIRTLNEYGVFAGREDEFTGVWVREEKIAAIGVKVSRWVTMHGFALNVGTDTEYFDRIIPCGIFHKGVVSLHQCVDRNVPLTEVQHHLIHHFSHVFNVRIKQISREELENLLHHHEAVEEKT